MSLDTQQDVLTSTTLSGVGKKAKVKRTFYVDEALWEKAKAIADADPRGKNISDIVRELLEGYVKRGGKR